MQHIGDRMSWLTDSHYLHHNDTLSCLRHVCPNVSYDVNNYIDQGINSIIMFENCVPGFNDITVDTIYRYYDDLLVYINFLRRKYRYSLIMWSKPVMPSDTSVIVRILHQYLTLKHLIHDNGVLVIQPEMVAKRRIASSFNHYHNVHDAIQYQLQYMNILSIESLKILSSKLSSQNNSSRLAAICDPLINTRKYDERCFPYPDHLFPLLITGLGGSGTHEITNKLRERGVRVRHEQIDVDGTVSWFHAVNDNYGTTAYPHHAALDNNANYFSPRFSKVIHIIRCPVKQISSFTTHLKASYLFVYEHMVLMKQTWENYMNDEDNRMKSFIVSSCNRGEKCNLHFSALSWLFWNNHVHKYADSTFHVENIDGLLAYICTIVKCDKRNNIKNDNSIWYIIRKVRTILGLKNKRDVVSSSDYHKKHNEYNIQQIASDAGTNIAAHIHATSSKVYGYHHHEC